MMKTKEELLSMLYAILAELQGRKGDPTLTPMMFTRLTAKLELLNDILGDDVPEEYWEQIEELI